MSGLFSRGPELSFSSGRQFLNHYVKFEKSALSLAVLAGAFATLLMLVQWLTFAYLAEQIIVQQADAAANNRLAHNMLAHSQLVFVLLGCVVFRALLTRLQSLLSQKASLNIRQHIRQMMLQNWRSTSPLLLKELSTGARATQFVEEVELMDGYYARYWPQQALALISPLMIVMVVSYLNWLCGLLLILSAPLIPFFMVLVGMGAERLNQKYSTIRQRLSGHFLDRVSNLLAIRLLGAQNSVLQEVYTNSHSYRSIIIKTLKVAFLSSTVLEFFTSVAIAALAIYIGFVLYGAITWGPAEGLTLFTGLTILILAPEFFQPLKNLSQFYHDRASALGAANNLLESFNSAETMSPTPSVLDNSSANRQVVTLTLKQLSVGYSAEQPLIKNLNISLRTGAMWVISGDSGSGKTTLLNTLVNYMLPLQGEALINGQSAFSHAPMAYLPQKPWLKNDSVFANLKALAPDASKANMFDVLELLGLVKELEIQTRGLDSLIGEHGQGLSGGQMQRLAFARALLNPTTIILLDEPTARLDAQSKQYIVAALRRLKRRAILVVASHDPLLIEMSDRHLALTQTQSKQSAPHD